MGLLPDIRHGPGSGSSLDPVLLIFTGFATVSATALSAISICLQLKNYRKPILQRMVVRIMLMVPIYAISSLIALFSLEAAFVIDALRDIYEAFVIYCFFQLLVAYLGGERSLLILVHGRPPKDPPFPVNIFKREIDVSDPYTFLFLKRGILQYVQVKPILAVVTLLLKAIGKFNEGDLRANSGYLYVSIAYNTSICLALYCLAMFWLCVSEDLKPFRPMPKFLCVKGILFFSFWQSIGISILVAAGVISKLGPYTDSEHISMGLTDTLICFEMPLFAVAHAYAFSHKDYIDPKTTYVGRMPMYYAFRDAFGLKDVAEDSKATLRGEGMDYREFEPSEGYMHQGLGRERRIRAGLRYAEGGKKKYWLPKPQEETEPPGRFERGVDRMIKKTIGKHQTEDVYAPLLEDEAADVVHDAPDMQSPSSERDQWAPFVGNNFVEDGFELPFGEIDPADEELFLLSKRYLFGDYNYPCVDISSETARRTMWHDEERILRDERGAHWSTRRHSPVRIGRGYGATGRSHPPVGSPYKGKWREDSEWPDVQEERRRLVDHGDNRVDEVDAGDVKLRWTKKNKGQRSTPSGSASATSSPRVRTPREPPAMRQVPESRSRSHTPSTPSLPRTRTNSNTLSNPPSPKKQHALPPDAVDLVVEDDRAAQEDMTRERRRGEPTGRGLRKVYRRGYVVDEDRREEEEAEVEVDRKKAPQDVFKVADDDEEEVGDVLEDVREEPTLITEMAPPIHARIDVPSEDNPWA